MMGNVFPEVERILPQFPHKTRRVIFRNVGDGKFEELLHQGRIDRVALRIRWPRPCGLTEEYEDIHARPRKCRSDSDDPRGKRRQI